MPYLRVIKGPNVNKSYPLDKERMILGRNASCDIVFPANDFAVSREHACVLRQQTKFFVEDMGSRNGTYVNNQPITGRTPLKDNDTIRICDSMYSFHDAPTQTVPQVIPGGANSANTIEEETIEEDPEVFPFEASVSSASNHFLESQPAEKLRAMVEISGNLSRTLELEPLLPKIVESLFQIFKQADRCFIIFREEAIEKDKPVERLIPKVIKTRRGQDESSASYSRSIVRECIKTVQAFLSDDASSDKRFSMSQSIADFRIRSVMCAPLWTQDNKAFGVIQLDTQDRSKKFTQDDLGILMAVANQASVALENARMHEQMLAKEKMKRDMELAKQVQQSFLPLHLPKVEAYEFFAMYESAQEIGGDYYGFIELDGKLAVLLGDVAGKGVPSALLMAKLSADARFCLMREPDPAPALCLLNDLVYQNTSQMDRFITLAMAVFDPITHKLTITNAGHPEPLIYRKATNTLEHTDKEIIGLPMGILEGYPYGKAEYELASGDFVIVFSDGVTEPYDQQNNPVNHRAIEEAVKEGCITPKTLGERAIKLLKQYTAGKPPHDDITMVCFGRV